MPFISPYTLEEALSLRREYINAEVALVNGQAKSYRIGSREFQSLDLDVIQRRIRELTKLIEALQGNVSTKRAVTVVPRDL